MSIYFLLWSYFKIEMNYDITWGFILRWKSFWLGLHYSDYNDKYCLNIIPGFTIWWIGEEGKAPQKQL